MVPGSIFTTDQLMRRVNLTPTELLLVEQMEGGMTLIYGQGTKRYRLVDKDGHAQAVKSSVAQGLIDKGLLSPTADAYTIFFALKTEKP